MRYLGVGALVLAVCALWLAAAPVWAQDGGLVLVSSDVRGEFPGGIRFEADVRGEAEIAEVAVRLRIGQRVAGAYEYLDFDMDSQTPSELVSASLFYRTGTSARYIPPGTIIKYNFEITDVDGNRLDTEQREFIYEDGRFEWDEVSNGIVTVAYHGPVRFRAEDVLDAVVQTLGVMGPLLGAGVDEPIRITMYNNWPEMRGALPPSSVVMRRELITEGQAHSEEGVLLVLGGSRRARGVAAHEATHILVHRAGEGVLGAVPSWLNEGLAEYGNFDPGESFDRALAFAIATDNLLPITTMDSPPGDSQDILIFYGQARSIVRFMVDEFGEGRMRDLMATLKSGVSLRNALPEVYGLTAIELENLWRDELGVSHRQELDDVVLPTAVPTPALGLYSLDALRRGGSAATPVPAQEQPAQVAQEVQATATVQPTPTAQPAATAEQPADASQSVAAVQVQATATSEQPASRSEDVASGGCGAPRGQRGAVVEMSAIALLLVPAVLLVWRRFCV